MAIEGSFNPVYHPKRYQLAQWLDPHPQVPEQCLKAAFDQEVQEVAPNTPKELKDKAWELVRSEKLRNLEGLFWRTLCETFLAEVSEEEAEQRILREDRENRGVGLSLPAWGACRTIEEQKIEEKVQEAVRLDTVEPSWALLVRRAL